MARVAICFAFVFASLFCAEAKERKFDAGGVEVKIDMKKAKFKVYRKNAGENETDKIEMEWKHVEEVDAAGKEVLKSGKQGERHSIKDFKKQDFTFEDPKLVDLMPSEDFPNITDSAKATLLSFSSTINSIGKIKVDTYIVENAGSAGPDEESLWYVSPGDMKFNVELSDWKFCGHNMTCTHKKDTFVGEFVDVQVKIKGKNSQPVLKPGKDKDKGAAEGRAGKGKKSDFDMGGGINLALTNLIEIDGNVTEMPEGYPMVDMKGKDTTFTFRFPRFNIKAVYDPLLTTGERVTTPPPGPGGGSVSTATGGGQVAAAAGLSSLGMLPIILGALFARLFW